MGAEGDPGLRGQVGPQGHRGMTGPMGLMGFKGYKVGVHARVCVCVRMNVWCVIVVCGTYSVCMCAMQVIPAQSNTFCESTPLCSQLYK